MEILTCSQAKQVDLVSYLASIGYQPQKIRSNDYWYLSPLRDEKTASFKVDRKLNVWYDHGIGKGGDLIDFGTLYHSCSVSDLLRRLSEKPVTGVSFHPQQAGAVEKKDSTESRIIILDSRPLTNPSLVSYSHQRHISLAVAQPYCREVDFRLYHKKYTAIGFQNDAGGYELRSENFKGSSAPKGVTFVNKGAKSVAVFEGFFDFLSFFTSPDVSRQPVNFLVLNSLSFLEKSRSLMDGHERVNLYLDRGKSGLQATERALQWSIKYKDCSEFYKGYEDLNEWLVNGRQQKQKLRQQQGKGFRL